MALEQQSLRQDRAQENNTHLDNDDEEYESGSNDEDGSCTDEQDDRKDEESEEEEDEPVLKYRRFAKEVVDSLCEAQSKNVVVCMAIHKKVNLKCPTLKVLIN